MAASNQPLDASSAYATTFIRRFVRRIKKIVVSEARINKDREAEVPISTC